MANYGLTNTQMVEYLDLPDTIINDLATAQGDTFVAVANQFLSALFNKVIYQSVDSMTFENPFKKYDSFPLRYGDTIENIYVETPRGYKYDKDATDPFARKNPSVKTLYASINYEMQYETTIYDSLLRRAVLNEYGFMNLIDTILSSLQTAKSLDEYSATLRMLNNADIFAEGFQQVEKGTTNEETAKIVTETIVNNVSDFGIPSKENNALGVLQTTPSDRILLIIKTTLLNSINLDYLAGVYNLSKVDLIKNIIPVRSFRVENESGELVGEDLDFMLIDTKGFDNHVALEDGGMIYNPKGKYTNHFYNLWKVISFKYFYNARAFKLVDAVSA